MFDFTLPPERVARYPKQQRSSSQLLRVHRHRPSELSDHSFSQLDELLKPGDILVVNNSRVIPARLVLEKPTGGKVELLFEKETQGGGALALLGSNKPLADGVRLSHSSNSFAVEVGKREQGALRHVHLVDNGQMPWKDILDKYGETPLPGYMRRDAESLDVERYQTVYAKHNGSVAAPTAGLHFDKELLAKLQKKGIHYANVTLHVGYGTFAKLDEKAEELHSERYELQQQTVDAIKAAKKEGGRVIAVGTTTARVLESVAQKNVELVASAGETRLFIKPGFQFRVIDGLITNFHLPKTSLLWLVCAFGGIESLQAAYQHAVDTNYRFYSYGDAMLIM